MLFSIFFPLSKQTKHPNLAWEWIKYGAVLLELISLSFFTVDRSTYLQSLLSTSVNFVDLASLQRVLTPYISFVSVGLLAYLILLIAFLLIVAVLYPVLIRKQPWIVRLIRLLLELTVTVLLIPFLNLAISQFDCIRDSSNTFFFRGTDLHCFGSDPIPGAVGLAMSICFLATLFFILVLYYLLIYQHNPKYGGFFSTPTFQFQLLQAILLYGTVFAMRMLINWPFWRFLVTVGVSAFLVLWVLVQQPYYHFMGNFLTILRWTIFGCIRAFLELAYLIGGFITTASASTIQLIITVVCAVVGAGCSVGLSILFFRLLSNRTRRKWLLTDDGMPLADPDHPSRADLPKMKNFKRVEPSVRFIQQKKFKSYDYLSYADLIYTTALIRHKTKAELHFHYANFLTHFRKNHVKAQSVYRTARMSNPSWPLRFQLFCQTKEVSSRGGVGNEMANAQFQLQMSKAEEMHETAKNAMRDFFSNLTAPHPKLSVIPTLLHLIVENEAKARKIYEDQLNTHPQSTRLLRQYASLLLDIYDDEDMTDIIIQRADQIEEDSTATLPTATGGTDPQAALQPIDPKAEQDEKASRMSKASGASGASGTKLKKKKKKKGNALVTELGSGGSGNDLKSQKRTICACLVTFHFLMILALVMALIVFISLASTYSTDLSTLRRMTRLAEYAGRTSTYALMFFIQQYYYGFVYQEPADKKSSALMSDEAVRDGLKATSAFLTSVLTEIFDLTSFTEPWLSRDVDCYSFVFDDSSDNAVKAKVTEERMDPVTLTTALNALAQKSSEMGESITTPIHVEGMTYYLVTYPTFAPDYMYLLANSQQPIMNGLKRAIFGYMDETSASADQLLWIYLVVLVGTGGVIASAMMFVYFYFTRKMMVTRKKALIDLLEVPKPKLQSVIRRLISTSDETTMTGNTVTFDDISESEHNEAVDEQLSETTDHLEMDENTQIPNTTSESAQPLGLSSFVTPSDYRPKPLLGIGSVSQVNSIPGQTFVPTNQFDMKRNSLLSTNQFDFKRNSLLSLNQSTPQSIFSTNQSMPQSVFSVSQSTPQSIFSTNQSMPQSVFSMNQSTPQSVQSPGTNPNDLQSPPTQSFADNLSPEQSIFATQFPGQTTSIFQNQPGMMGGVGLDSPLPQFQMGMNMEQQKKMEAKTKKQEEKKRKAEEEEKKRKLEEKQKREQEAKRKKDEEAALLASGQASEAQKGYIRDVIKDEKWVEKIEKDVQNLTQMHLNLPSPLSTGIVVNIMLSMGLGLVILISLVVVAIVMVNQFNRSNVNITMSGMRTSILSLIEFLNLRILFPDSHLVPFDDKIDFSRSTNPVCTGFQFLSDDVDELYPLLVKSSAYFQQLHSATHYGDSEYAFANDSYYDNVPTTRLSTKENEATLLQNGNCFMEPSEEEFCSNESRIFNFNFPMYGLSTLISQMRLYIWMMKFELHEVDVNGTSLYTELHHIPRYLGSAIRYDLRSGVNRLTNEILATSQQDVTTTVTLLTVGTVVGSFLFIMALIIFTWQWLNRVMMNNEESVKLHQLLPVSHEERSMELLPSMQIGLPALDQGRMKIIDAALSVLESLDKHEKPESLNNHLDYLMITTTQIFTEEETEMEKRDYEHLEDHTREHILIRQRLSFVIDEIRRNHLPTTKIAIRSLTRLFDRHFIDDDVQFGHTIPQHEKMMVGHDQEHFEEAVQEVGELGEPGQDAT
ncbi:hypothetical protein BLNAU_10765 [Blattamonas nauphoetae]|uniref:TmcB/TmcC TPR repeats domain-containing protein n=1 Tax=Blattamonas nauphoetae TaxID=2049346 RepID=A0ABQ9XSX4_9EUKA|nr:hypothetical protein BLNAU_10765 [Blattamonas nauphoetae]